MTAAVVYRLDLPFTRPPLLDNSRMHWAAKARHTRQLRGDALLLAMAAKLPQSLPAASVTLHWQPGTNRRRDALSAAPTLKPLLDGLVDAGVFADDDIHHVTPGCRVYDWQRGTPAACWLTITPAPPTEGTTK